ncbi:hypothetical protein BDF19DRAFT_444475 [Syncephalis fuscata]|nr:hypothetical protein BDF19DRAFT_444475 [Syncephalis fuscata]
MASTHASRAPTSWLRTEALRAEDLSRETALSELSTFMEQYAPGATGIDYEQTCLTIGAAYQLELVRCSLAGVAPPPPPAFLSEAEPELQADSAEWPINATGVEPSDLAGSQHAAVDVMMLDPAEETVAESVEPSKKEKKKKKKKPESKSD